MEEHYPPVRIAFGRDVVVVEDGPALAPALRISGALSDLVALRSGAALFAGALRSDSG